MSIGERLKEARKAKGFSQDKLAEAIGTSRTVITDIERDKTEHPRVSYVDTICKTLEISKEWLLREEGPMAYPSPEWNANEILTQIHEILVDLRPEEQIYVLDMIKTYEKHRIALDKES